MAERCVRRISDRLRGSIMEVAKAVGSPVWLYDADVIRNRIARLRNFDVVRYAQKANSNLSILQLMRAEGVRIDAVSLGEIERAIAAGYEPGSEDEDIVFTADVFDRATLRRVVDLGIPVNCGSADMIDQLGALAAGHPVWLRINPGFGHGHNRKTNTGGPFSKHGIWHEYLDESLRKIDQTGLNLVGIHMHIGSGVDYDHLRLVCDAMVAVATRINRPLEAISAGGGMTIPYHDDDVEFDTAFYFQAWQDARRQVEQVLRKQVRLETEPGRYLVGSSGYLVAEVRAVKQVAGRTFVLLDGGFNTLARPALYGSHHDIAFISAEGAEVQGQATKVAIGGPLCEAGDVFTQNAEGFVTFRDLPVPAVGDYAVFFDVGAYGASMSSNYNSHPLAPEVLLDGGEMTLVRRRQDLSSLFALEQWPEPVLRSRETK